MHVKGFFFDLGGTLYSYRNVPRATAPLLIEAAERLGLDERKVVVNIDRYGNTTGATIPLALGDAVADGRLKKGDLVLLASVGAGFTVGSVLLRWGF